MDDRGLIAIARCGDTAAFEKLVGASAKKVYNYALRLTDDAARADDLCQEAFIKAFLAIRSFDDRSAFSTWIYRIVHNTFIDSTRKAAPGSGRHDETLDDRAADIGEISPQ